MNNEFNFQTNSYTGFESPKKKSQDGFAIASLILGILSVVSCCCCCFEILGLILTGVSAILAIVFAFVSKKNTDGKMDGKATAGLILGIVGIVMLIVLLVVLFGTYSMIGSIPEEEMMQFLEENFKPAMEGNEETYNELVEAVKQIYATRGSK